MANIAKIGDENKFSSSSSAVARIIDQTYLKAGANEDEIKKVCEETKQYGFRGFCIFPEHTKLAKEELKNMPI